jgi:hypothetical protein
VIRALFTGLNLAIKWIAIGGWTGLHVIFSSLYQNASALKRQVRDEWAQLRAQDHDDEF